MSDPLVLDELERRLGKATRPDIRLAGDVLLGVGAVDMGAFRKGSFLSQEVANCTFSVSTKTPHNITASLDSALALVDERLPGWAYTLDFNGDEKVAEMFAPNWPNGPSATGSHETSMATALLLALIRALKKKGNG